MTASLAAWALDPKANQFASKQTVKYSAPRVAAKTSYKPDSQENDFRKNANLTNFNFVIA